MRRRMLASVGGKPLPYDAEVEYLDSDGSQYIDTGFVPDLPTCGFAIEVALLRDNGDVWLCGCAQQASNGRFLFGDNSVSKTSYIGFGGLYSSGWLLNRVLLSKYDAKSNLNDDGIFTINDIILTRKGDTYPGGQFSFVAFGRKSYTGAITSYAQRIYSLKLSRNSDLIHDFVFVRVGPRENCLGFMYDRNNPSGGPFGNGLYGDTAHGNAGFPMSLVGPDKT